jgi:hypothetical protein
MSHVSRPTEAVDKIEAAKILEFNKAQQLSIRWRLLQCDQHFENKSFVK